MILLLRSKDTMVWQNFYQCSSVRWWREGEGREPGLAMHQCMAGVNHYCTAETHE